MDFFFFLCSFLQADKQWTSKHNKELMIPTNSNTTHLHLFYINFFFQKFNIHLL